MERDGVRPLTRNVTKKTLRQPDLKTERLTRALTEEAKKKFTFFFT